MSKKKAIVCTVLYVFVLVVIFTVAFFIKSEEYGLSLYQLIMYSLAYTYISEHIKKFYIWLQN